MEYITGEIEKVGTQFNGSLLVNGKWFNFKKGVEPKGKVGDKVKLTLQSWEFKGKSGLNIVEVESIPEKSKAVVVSKPEISPARDFSKEARGKTVCQYIAAQLSNPGVDVNDVDGLFDRAVQLMEKTFNLQ